jgi:FHA domain
MQVFCGSIVKQVSRAKAYTGQDKTFIDFHVWRLKMSKATYILEAHDGIHLKEYSLNKQSIDIGRRSANDVVLAGGNVSRYHAKLKWRQGAFCVMDLASSNGTKLNGIKLESHTPYPLKNGDIISIGQHKLTLKSDPGKPNGRIISEPESDHLATHSVWSRIVIIILIILALAALSWWLIPMALSAGLIAF